MARYYLMTDLEGAVGVERFEQVYPDGYEQKAEVMDQLAQEVNACIEGIRQSDPDATVDVIDGHGSGGVRAEDVDGNWGRFENGQRFEEHDYDAVLYVGQHAMAGTPFATLRHTFSQSYEYVRLNGTFVGEFAGFALVAGQAGVPVIFLSGDDRAACEAEMFVSEIETAVVKRSRDVESADHLDPSVACDRIRAASARAVERTGEVPPFTRFEPPYTTEIRFCNPVDDRTEATEGWRTSEATCRWLDDRTVRFEGEDYRSVPPYAR